MSVAQLLGRMRNGDRVAAAEFVHRFEPMIRRRIRSRLNSSMRRLFDSSEIFSTVCRRLDEYVMKRSIEAEGVPQLLSLMQTITQHSIADKERVILRLRAVEEEDTPIARRLGLRAQTKWSTERGSYADVERIFGMLDSENDRSILMHWLWGMPHNVTAEQLGMTHAAVRKRWQLIRERLAERLSDDERA
ncbi:MAG: RNA polymerase sigma factor [Phycisphaerales bacterium]|nr:MAG: sigma-70 family RNA polymerase sigma factor [Phycisphaerales bacterium]